MANNHGYLSTAHCTCWDVDANNCVGIFTEDLDNGVVVTLTKMVQSGAKDVEGYEFEVAKGSAATTYADAWVVATPPVGNTLEMQMLSDPRYFYNEKNKPMALVKLVADVDCVFADKNTFGNATLPTTEKYAIVTANGKLQATNSKPAAGIIYWDILGFEHVAVGAEDMKVAVLRTRVSAGA